MGHFYPRPPGGGRQQAAADKLVGAVFLSTPSGWRATFTHLFALLLRSNFYPRPPGGGRPWIQTYLRDFIIYFYPRPPGGGRQSSVFCTLLDMPISIHALRVEGDSRSITCRSSFTHFYPRPPGGGRPREMRFLFFCAIISIHALRVEGDCEAYNEYHKQRISIHALRVEGDAQDAEKSLDKADFYPRPPGGGRQRCRASMPKNRQFLSTPSGWRATDGDGFPD